MILSHSLARLERMHSNKPTPPGGRTRGGRGTIALPVLAGDLGDPITYNSPPARRELKQRCCLPSYFYC